MERIDSLPQNAKIILIKGRDKPVGVVKNNQNTSKIEEERKEAIKYIMIVASNIG